MKITNLFIISLIILLLSNTAFSQELEWAIQAGGDASGSEYISEIAFDSEGNVYATGKIGDGATIGEGANQITVSTEGAFDLFVAKYDTDGNLIWFFTEAGPAGNAAQFINVDTDGNIYIAGAFSESLTFDNGTTAPVTITNTVGLGDMYVACYNSNQEFQWVKQITASDNFSTSNGIDMDSDNNIILSGYFRGYITIESTTLTNSDLEEGYYDLYVIKLNSAGELDWAFSAGSNESWDRVYGATFDNDGNILITGKFRNDLVLGKQGNQITLTAPAYTDLYVAKFDADANILWANSASSPYTAVSKAVTTDDEGNCYITGYFQNTCLFGEGTPNEFEIANPDSPNAETFLVAKYDINGNFQWVKQTTTSNSMHRGTNATIDNNQNLHIAGWFENTITFQDGTSITSETAGYCDIFFVEFTTDGELLTVNNEEGSFREYVSTIKFDQNNNMFIAGRFGDSSSPQTITFGKDDNQITLTSVKWDDIFFVKYSPEIPPLTYTVTFNVTDELEPDITLTGYGTQTATGGTTTFTEVEETTSIEYSVNLEGYQIITNYITVDGDEIVEITLVPISTYSVTFNVTDGLEPEITLTGYGTQTATGGTTIFTEVEETPSPGIEFTANLSGYEVYTDNIIVDGDEIVDITLSPAVNTHSVTFNVTDELEPEITLTGYGTQTTTGGTTTFTEVEETSSIEYSVNLGGYQIVTDNITVDGDEIVEINLIPTNIQNLENKISIYPNPSNGIFTLDFKTSTGLLNASITDITGKTIKQFVIRNSKFVIDLQKQPAGVYFLTIQSNNEIFTQKLIIK